MCWPCRALRGVAACGRARAREVTEDAEAGVRSLEMIGAVPEETSRVRAAAECFAPSVGAGDRQRRHELYAAYKASCPRSRQGANRGGTASSHRDLLYNDAVLRGQPAPTPRRRRRNASVWKW